MEANKPVQKYIILISAISVLVLTTANIVQQYKYKKSISKMSQAVTEMNEILIKEQATQLILLKRIKHYYNESNQGPEMLSKITELQKNTVLSYLQNENISEQTKSILENSLKCLPMSCELNTPNQALKVQPSAAGDAASGAP